MSRRGGQDSVRELGEIPGGAVGATCTSIDGAGDPRQAAREDLVLAVERVDVDRIGRAIETAQHGDHRARVVAGCHQERDRALVRLDLVVALVRQAAADRARIAERRLAVDLEQVIAVIERDVRHLVGEQRGQLRLRTEASERATGHVDEAAQERVALGVGRVEQAEAEGEIGAAGVRRDPPPDPRDVGGQPAVRVGPEGGRHDELVEDESDAAVARHPVALGAIAVGGAGRLRGGRRRRARRAGRGAGGGEEEERRAGGAAHGGSSPPTGSRRMRNARFGG